MKLGDEWNEPTNNNCATNNDQKHKNDEIPFAVFVMVAAFAQLYDFQVQS